jgi:hypothetical protein
MAAAPFDGMLWIIGICAILQDVEWHHFTGDRLFLHGIILRRGHRWKIFRMKRDWGLMKKVRESGKVEEREDLATGEK